MAKLLHEELIEIIKKEDTIKMLATTNSKGIPHLVAKDSVSCDKDGNLFYLEYLEGSVTNKNMIYSLWFDKLISINILSKDNRSFQVRGIPRKALIAGTMFEKFYKLTQTKYPNRDLAVVYYIEIQEVIDETYEVRENEHTIKHPLYMHIDRISK